MRLRSSREIQHFRNVMHDIQRRNSSSISGIRYEDDVLSNVDHTGELFDLSDYCACGVAGRMTVKYIPK